jgi:hypothetical protein
MDDAEQFERFSLLGGPLHRLGCRFGLVRGDNTVALGLVLGVVPWAVFMALAVIGLDRQHFLSLSVIEGHVRLLVVIPLFFLGESWFDPRARAFVRSIVRSGVVPESAQPTLASEIGRVERRKDAGMPEVICLLAAVLLSAFGSYMPGATAAHDPNRAMMELPLAGVWYWTVCLTVFRFLMFRWLWRLILWCYFLWRVARLDLHLVPTHPDSAAGLGYLEIVQTHFIPLVLANSALLSASFAEEIATGSATFETIYPALLLVLIVDAVMFLGPLCIFMPKLWACRVNGLSDYMGLAAQYVNGFDKKWLGEDAPPAEPLLGTADIQSLADLSNSMAIVRNMRSVPLSMQLLTTIGVAAVVPMVPLLLLKYPIAELAKQFLKMLSGI